MSTFVPPWLDWVSRLQALAQTGLNYAQNSFEVERYTAVRQIAAEMLAQGAGAEISVIRNLFSRDSGYATPKVDVRGVVFRDDALLLVRERADGLWTPPGGWADVGESPRDNVVREILEESGYNARPVRLLAVFDRARHPHDPPLPFHVYKLFIECELLGGQPTPSSETTEVGFFRENELPPLSLDRITPDQVARLFEHRRNRGLPPDFD